MPQTRFSAPALLAALMLAFSTAFAQQPPAKGNEWKLSAAVGPAFALGAAADHWARHIAERSGDKLAAKLYPGAALADRDALREFTALSMGTADLAIGSSLLWSTQIPELNVIGLPWIAPDMKALDALLTVAMKERLDVAIERAGAIPLAYAALGLRSLATTTSGAQTPEALKGLKLRIGPNPLVADLLIALGAEPKTMAFADAQAALKARMLDAQEGTLATITASRIDALGVKHVLVWGATGEIAIFAANRAFWNRLSAADQAIVREAANAAAAELPALVAAENDGAIAELSKRGVTVTRLTASGRAAFAFAARSAYEKWEAVAGADLVRAAEAAVAAMPQ
ncbi:MAG TPA: TRAP transporter substrate-binding protein DctP [Casimicrobiaceae bacterium]|nr:TRAP transporter substrate-binding protein DctP [Casimicrobiaceae bacterium]